MYIYNILLLVDKDTKFDDKAAKSVIDFPRKAEEIKVVVLNVFEEVDRLDGDGVPVDFKELYENSLPPKSVDSIVKQSHPVVFVLSDYRNGGVRTELMKPLLITSWWPSSFQIRLHISRVSLTNPTVFVHYCVDARTSDRAIRSDTSSIP